jgi:hypothetical protein
MFKECQKDNVLMFPKNKQYPEIGSVNVSVLENGEVNLASHGLSVQEMRIALGVAVHLACDVERNSSV